MGSTDTRPPQLPCKAEVLTAALLLLQRCAAGKEPGLRCSELVPVVRTLWVLYYF